MSNVGADRELYDRLTRAEMDVRAILDGEKVTIGEDNKWLVDQLTRLRAGFFVSETPYAYTTTPGESDESKKWKGDTRYHPLGYSLVQEQKSLDQYLEKADIKNFKVLGVDYGFRNTATPQTAQASYADNFVLPQGDLYSLWQFIGMLKGKLENDSALDGKNLVIQNIDGFWDPFLHKMGLDDPTQNLVTVTGNYIGTQQAIESSGTDKTLAPRIAAGLKIEPGSTILVATHTSNKVHEARAIFEALHADVRVLPFNIIAKPEEAKETSLTYAGNDMEKVRKAWSRIDGMGAEKITQILSERGIDPAKTWVLFDDRGLELAEPLMKHQLFDECRSYLNPYKQGPGVELASVLKSMSREDLHARLHEAADELALQRGTPGNPGFVDRSANELATYMFSPILPDATGKRDVYAFMAIQDNTVTFVPRPEEDICKYPEHFIEPKNDPEHRTAAQIPDFIETKSCAALAAQTAAYTLDIESHAEGETRPRNEFNKQAEGRPWRIGTQHALWGGEYKPLKQIDPAKFSFLPHVDEKYDPVYDASTQPNDGKHIRENAAGLNNFYEFARDSDAFLLTPDQKKDENTFAKDMFMFFSNIVGKQIDDPVFAGKPFIVMDGADTAWETAMNVYYHLHRNGFAGDKPKHVFKRRDLLEGSKEESALGYIGDYMKRYIPDYVGQRDFQEHGQRAPDDLYRVTIYCSATSTNENFRKQAHDLAFDLASESFAVKNGGGTDGLMVETSNGVHDFREWWKQNHPNEEMPKNHISSIQCEDTYKSEGLCSDNDYVCVHPNIFQRMADLTDTDAEIVLWGGAGTVQEMMGSIMLREAGITPSHGRPLVIVNAEIGKGEHKTRVFDPLIKAMPAWYLEKLNVHVVNTPQEAMEIVREARWIAGRAPGPLPDGHELFKLRSDPPGPGPNGPA